MSMRTVPRGLFVLLLLLPALLACDLLGQALKAVEATATAIAPTWEAAIKATATPVPPTKEVEVTTEATATAIPPTEEVPAEASPTRTPQPSPTTEVVVPPGAIHQWAVEAEASSEYGSVDWAASQATGAPDTPECGDMVTSWAAASSSTVEWINLYFEVPVYPAEIRIIEPYNADQVVQVDVIDMQGQFVTVYTAEPKQVDSPCPYTLSIPVSGNDLLAQGVRITIDQSLLGWNEIDAVEIVGLPGEGTPVRPPTPTATP